MLFYFSKQWRLVVIWGLIGLCLKSTIFAQQVTSSHAPANDNNTSSGGAAQADFDSLIDLIQSTVAYDSWMENGTGEGEISPFAINGIYAAAQGTLRFVDSLNSPAKLLRTPPPSARETADVRRPSHLRFVSLPRLERAIGQHQRAQTPLPGEMLTLAGLQRVEYVIIKPETKDLILAGPAGDWLIGPTGTLVSLETGRAVLRLDDLLTLWRRAGGSSPFGCSIVPRQQALAATQEYLRRTGAEPLEPGGRKKWLSDLRDTLGSQDVKFFGLTPNSHAALVLLVADYHMKLIGMGLADSVPDVTNYLDTVQLDADGSAPAMSVLRWWFAMNHGPVQTDATRKLFRLPGDGVKVLSENELLAARGERVHTNQSEELNQRFANSFTVAFGEISEKYPLYGELENLFDLALALAIIEREQLLERAGWQPVLLKDSAGLPLPALRIPGEVQTVVNHRMINSRQIIAGISGGVWVDSRQVLKLETVDADQLRSVSSEKASATAVSWWWD